MLQICVAMDLANQRPEYDLFKRRTLVKEEVAHEKPTRGLRWPFCRLSFAGTVAD